MKIWPAFQAGQLGLQRSVFEEAFGQPDKTQTVGNQLFLYYRCRDGVICVRVESNAFELAKILVGDVNDF